MIVGCNKRWITNRDMADRIVFCTVRVPVSRKRLSGPVCVCVLLCASVRLLNERLVLPVGVPYRIVTLYIFYIVILHYIFPI